MTRRGFSLIELVVVVLILAVLATIVVPRVTESASNAKKAKCQANIANMNRAIELCAARNDGNYPNHPNIFVGVIILNPDYFPHGAPVCPYGTPYIYNPSTRSVTAHNH